MDKLTRDVCFWASLVVSATVGGISGWALPLPNSAAGVVAALIVGVVVGVHVARLFIWLRERRTRRGDLEYDYKRVR